MNERRCWNAIVGVAATTLESEVECKEGGGPLLLVPCLSAGFKREGPTPQEGSGGGMAVRVPVVSVALDMVPSGRGGLEVVVGNGSLNV